MEPIETSGSITLSSFIWKAGDDLWDNFKHTNFVRIIIPPPLLRRLKCVLELTKEAALKEHGKLPLETVSRGRHEFFVAEVVHLALMRCWSKLNVIDRRTSHV